MQIMQAHDLRLIGTNLYDFSKAPPIIGEVTQVYPQSITVKSTGQTYYKFASPAWAMKWNPAQHDQYAAYRMMTHSAAAHEAEELAAAEEIMPLVNKAEAIANLPANQQADAYNRASSSVQEFLHKATPIVYFQLLHPPSVTIGERIYFYAAPTKSPGFWDLGEPYTGDLAGFKYIFRVLPDQIVRERLYSPAEKQELALKILSFQLERASNNVASDQFDIGKRYLTGEGVETNQSLGIYWINAAASNSFPAAILFQKTLTNYIAHPPRA